MVDWETRKDCISKRAVLLFFQAKLYICTSQEEELVLFPFKSTQRSFEKVIDGFSL